MREAEEETDVNLEVAEAVLVGVKLELVDKSENGEGPFQIRNGRVVLGAGSTVVKAVIDVLRTRDGLADNTQLALLLAAACSIDVETVVSVSDQVSIEFFDEEDETEDEEEDGPRVRVRRES